MRNDDAHERTRRVTIRGSASSSDWIPAWIHSIGSPLWLVDPDGRLAHVNEAAAKCFGVRTSDCLGKPCHEVVRGHDESGAPHCQGACAVRRAADRGDPQRPLLLRRDAGRDSGPTTDWFLVQVFAIPGPGGEGRGLVHVAHDVSRMRRTYEYLRQALGPSGARGSLAARLTPRETEILDRLARNEDQKQIAFHLHISYATVRNHVQNILRKLDAHSVQEAVAIHLLSTDGER